MSDHDKKKDKLKREESTTMKLELSTNSKGELEASVEETNRIRASLGLKPLKIEQKKEDKPTKRNSDERKTAEIADQISQLKKKRMTNKVIGKSLGEILEEEEEDAASWVTKARVLQEDQIKRDKELAIQRALELEARDKEIEHTGSDLKGLKVAHNLDNFQDIGEGVILTLKDTNILKDANSLNEEEADLENIKISEKERLKKYLDMKKKKPVYNAYDEESNKSVLPQYDEEKKESAGFTITNSGKIVSQVQLEEIRNKLNANKDKNIPQISLDSSKLLASEYMTPAEESAIKIKKTGKKKKKLRKKALDELVPEEETGNKDRGSRSESAKIKAEEERAVNEKEKREKSYQKAIDKAQSSINKDVINEEDVNNNKNKEENEISNIIKIKQQASVSKKKESEDAILQRVQLNAKNREEQSKKQASEEQSLIFTSTTEFVRAIQPIDTTPTATTTSATSSAPTSSERDKEIMEDIEEHEKMLQQANKKRKQREAEEALKQEAEKQEEEKMDIVKTEEEEEEEEEEGTTPFEVLEDHTRSGGMAAVLKMLQHKKPSDDLMWAGRRTDEKPGLSGDKGIKLEYKDDFGRIRTPKEEFRELSHRFHGKKPGKNKQEKRQKQYEEDMKKLQVLNESTSLVQTMQAEQEKRATPYLVLGASIKSLTTETASGLSKVGAPAKKSDTNTASKTSTTATTSNDNNNVTTANVIQQQTKGGELKGEFKEFKIEKKQKLQ